jgi:hypothetical protein
MVKESSTYGFQINIKFILADELSIFFEEL